jgi:hypothetical protein
MVITLLDPLLRHASTRAPVNLLKLYIVKIIMEIILTLLKSNRILFVAGLVFLASALFHAAVWWLAGMPTLTGPVSWRKPITFGLSTGVLLLSLGWVLGLLPVTPRRQRQAWLLSALLVAEVGLIDMQQWRGVASHFNAATAFDSAVFTTMGVLILAARVVIALWTRDVFTQPLAASRLNVLAIRTGMVMLNVGNLIGLAMSVSGLTALKPLHGAALHVIQALPVAAWTLVAILRAWRRFSYPRTWFASRVSRWFSSPHWQHR